MHPVMAGRRPAALVRASFGLCLLLAGAAMLSACGSSTSATTTTKPLTSADACFSDATGAVTTLLGDVAANNSSALSADSIRLGLKYGTTSQTWQTVTGALTSMTPLVGHVSMSQIIVTAEAKIRTGCASPGATAITTTTMPPTTTAAPPVATVPPTTAAPRETVTYGSPSGPIVWQTGDPIPAGPDGTAAGNETYEGYYCTHPPFPDGMDRSGSAGCSGNTNGQTGQVVGGFFLNHVS